MNVFMFLQSCLLFFYLIRIIVAKNQHDRTLVPYKSLYGVPIKCTGNSDPQTTEEKYQACQLKAIGKWKIKLQHYYTESWNFCCFVYDVLECETKVLSECDEDYSDRNDKETRLLFDKSCQPIIANNPCGKSGGGGKDWIWKGLGIAAGVGLFLYLLYECIQFWRKEYNTELKALEAYKEEKFQKYYEKEFVRAVYDNEVDNLNKQRLTNVSVQKNENGEPIEKQDNVKLSKKDLKKIEKKVRTLIEAKSKNDPTFLDDFIQDSTKYYEKPTGVLAKSKKFFTRLWQEKKVNNEELMKKEELIRSQARRQFENIHNVDQSQSTKPGKLKSLIVTEDENTDSLLAKMLNILNQEQVAVHETMRTTDFPEPGKIDELEKWTKDFKDTRNRIRNEINKTFEMTLERPISEDQTDKIEETKNKLVDTKLKQISESVQETDSNKQLKASNDQTNKITKATTNDQVAKISKSDSFKKTKTKDKSVSIVGQIKSEMDQKVEFEPEIFKYLSGVYNELSTNEWLADTMQQTSDQLKSTLTSAGEQMNVYLKSLSGKLYEMSPKDWIGDIKPSSYSIVEKLKNKFKTGNKEISDFFKKTTDKAYEILASDDSTEMEKQKTRSYVGNLEPIEEEEEEQPKRISKNKKDKKKPIISSDDKNNKQSISESTENQTTNNETVISSKIKNKQTSILLDNMIQSSSSSSKPIDESKFGNIKSIDILNEENKAVSTKPSPELTQEMIKIKAIPNITEEELIIMKKIAQLQELHGRKNLIDLISRLFDKKLQLINNWIEDEKTNPKLTGEARINYFHNGEINRLAALKDVENMKRAKQINLDKIDNAEKSLVSGFAFKDEIFIQKPDKIIEANKLDKNLKIMTESEFNNNVSKALDKYDGYLKEDSIKSLNEQKERLKHTNLKNVFKVEKILNYKVEVGKEITKKLREMMMEKKARTKRQAYDDGKETQLSEAEKNETEKQALKKLLKKKSSSKNQTSLNGQDSSSSSNDFSDSDETRQLTMLKQKSANLSKQTMIDQQPMQQNNEISQSTNIIDSLMKRIKKTINRTILSAAKEIPKNQQFTDYTKQF
ncbi:uncharacterized protein LOC113791609 [Dermatophagoides pteronyssinus]|uniref:uncharacterized protein LOC113791609 n=1 Tax=Dermatophagoides pteronyssinus TaxID=6956 RepID=UPI003F66CBB3